MKETKSELMIITRAKDLSYYVMTVTQILSKHFRHTFFSRMQNLALDIIENLYRANDTFYFRSDQANYITAVFWKQKRSWASIIFKEFKRQVNHIFYLLDKLTVYERVGKDDLSVRIFLPKFSLPQIIDFIQIASEHKATNVLPMLMEYKNEHFADFDPMDEFTLDLI